MKRYYIVLLSSLITFNILSQESNSNRGTRIILSSGASQGAMFYTYNPAFIVKAVYEDFSQVTNEYPELLLSSILSATNQNWYDYNILESSGIREKKDKSYFEYVRNMDREKTYIELLCKFQFEYQGSELAIIKFLFHTEEKETIGAYVMQKVDGRWYKTATPFTNDLSMFLIRTRTDMIEKIFMQSPGEDKYIDELISKIKISDGSISIFKLAEEYKSWFTNKDQEKIAHFKDPKSW